MSEVRHVAHRRAHGRREAAHRWVEVAVAREAVTQRVVAQSGDARSHKSGTIATKSEHTDGAHSSMTQSGDTVITRSGTVLR